MKKFLVLYMAPHEEMRRMMESSSPEEMKKGMEAWMTWAKKHTEITDLGAPLGKNVRVQNGTSTAAPNDVGGYSFVEAESQEAAAAIFADSPHFDLSGAYIEVMEVVEM